MNYKWIPCKKGECLVDTDTKQIIGYVYFVIGIKARVLDTLETYQTEDDVANINVGTVMWKRHTAEKGNGNTVEEAKSNVEAELHIVPCNPTDILAFLAKIKDFEIHGRIEIVIKIEGLPNKEVKI
jgi:hypothetical protein